MVETKKGIFFAFIVLSFALNSCQKFEEGPKISLRSRKARLTNDWKVSKAFFIEEDGSKTSIEPYEFYLTINKDNSFESDVFGTGSWELTGGNQLTLKNSPPQSKHYIWEDQGILMIAKNFDVLRLKEQDLWLRTSELIALDGEEIIVEFQFQ